MWILSLNPMRCRVEERRWVARAETLDQLKAFLTSETVADYRDENWHKVFRRGGPLEWFNPPGMNQDLEEEFGGRNFIDLGSKSDYMQRSSEEWDRQMAQLMNVTNLPEFSRT